MGKSLPSDRTSSLISTPGPILIMRVNSSLQCYQDSYDHFDENGYHLHYENTKNYYSNDFSNVSRQIGDGNIDRENNGKHYSSDFSTSYRVIDNRELHSNKDDFGQDKSYGGEENFREDENPARQGRLLSR